MRGEVNWLVNWLAKVSELADRGCPCLAGGPGVSVFGRWPGGVRVWVIAMSRIGRCPGAV